MLEHTLIELPINFFVNSQLAGKMLEYTTLIELPIKKFVNYRLAYSEGEVPQRRAVTGLNQKLATLQQPKPARLTIKSTTSIGHGRSQKFLPSGSDVFGAGVHHTYEQY
jgi:hypothetical protein